VNRLGPSSETLKRSPDMAWNRQDAGGAWRLGIEHQLATTLGRRQQRCLKHAGLGVRIPDEIHGHLGNPAPGLDQRQSEAVARSPINRAPFRRSCAATPSGDSARNPSFAKPSPLAPAFPGACGRPAETSGRYMRTQLTATSPSGSSTTSSPLACATARAGAVSTIRATARSRASL
jgi:hypothetical protein